MADFLNAVVRGEMKDFKPHHWIRAAKHLAARAYSREVDPERPGLSAQDAMKLIDRLFPGFKHYHRVDMKQIIHLGFQDMAADDDKPLNGSAAPHPYNRPDFDAARAQYEAGVRAETERRAEREAEVEDEAEAEDEPVPHMSGFEALRARYEARLRAEAKRRHREEDGSDPDLDESDDDRPWDKAPDRPWRAKRLSDRPGRLRVQARPPGRTQQVGAQGHRKGLSTSDGTAASRPDPDRPSYSEHNYLCGSCPDFGVSEPVEGRLIPLPPSAGED